MAGVQAFSRLFAMLKLPGNQLRLLVDNLIASEAAAGGAAGGGHARGAAGQAGGRRQLAEQQGGAGCGRAGEMEVRCGVGGHMFMGLGVVGVEGAARLIG